MLAVPGWFVQPLAKSFQDGLELLLGGVGRPRVHPMLDDFLAELPLDIFSIDSGGNQRRRLVGESLGAHAHKVADTLVQGQQGAGII